jgi:hypothetical protein
MTRHERHPLGVTIVVGVIAANGLASLIDAARFAVQAASRAPTDPVAIVDWPSAVVSLVLGILLLNRSYHLWMHARPAWIMTLMILGVREVLGVVRVIETPQALDAWITLVLATITILYLTQPRIRAIFLSAR